MNTNEIPEVIYQTYFSSLVLGRRIICGEIAQELFKNGIPVKDLYVRLFQRALYEIGELWAHNRISVAVEHMATSITEGLMNRIYPDIISGKRIGKRAIISAVENEQHQVGAKMVADMFEIKGWDSFYLGANTPTHDLLCFAQEIQPQVIALSLSVYFHMEELEKMIKTVRERFPALPILIGGQAFRHGSASRLTALPKVIFVSSLDDLEKMLDAGRI